MGASAAAAAAATAAAAAATDFFLDLKLKKEANCIITYVINSIL